MPAHAARLGDQLLLLKGQGNADAGAAPVGMQQ
jgi:hypothetical protein